MITMDLLGELFYPNILAVILAITALAASRQGGGRSSRVSNIINLMFVVLVIMVAFQFFCTLTDWSPMVQLYIPKWIATSIHNSMTVLYPGICCIFVYEYTYVRGKSKKVWALLVSPFFVWVVVLIINCWTGWVFSIDRDMVYHRGPLVYFTFILPLFSVVAGIIISRTGFKGNKNFLRFPIWIFALPAVGGVAVQAFFDVITIHLGLGIALCGACVSLKKDKLYLDALTGLYNRSYLFYVFSLIEKRRTYSHVAAIMLDINDFKSINDELGHQEGDKALVEVASILEKSLEKGGSAVRFAGDEFLVLISHQNIREALDETLEKIRLNTEIFNNRENNIYQVHFAVGSAVMRDGETPDEFLARIDGAMCQDKLRTRSASVSVRRRAYGV